MEHVALGFGGLAVLNNVSLAVRPGERAAVIGPNGAGKTSLLNCINGFYHPGAGRIRYRGRDITRAAPYDIARLGVGRTFQNIELFTGATVLDNLLLARHRHIRYGLLAAALYYGRAQAEETLHRARVEEVIRSVLCRPRDAGMIAADVLEMRNAIATEKGDSDRWNLKYVAGGLIDIEFIAQYLQLVHAAQTPDILDTSTTQVLDKAWRLGLLAAGDAELLRRAVRLYHDLTQILRLCLSAPFDPKAAAPGLTRLLARAADLPDFATLDAFIGETQAKVRASFNRILGASP